MFAQYSQVGVDHVYSASRAIYLHNFLCLVTICDPDIGWESHNPFMVECVCLLIPMYSLCECIRGQSLPTDPGCVPMQEDLNGPCPFQEEARGLGQMLESCVSQPAPNLKAIFCALPFNIWFMLVSCGVSASLGELCSTVVEMRSDRGHRPEFLTCSSACRPPLAPQHQALGTGCFMSLRIHSKASSSSCY